MMQMHHGLDQSKYGPKHQARTAEIVFIFSYGFKYVALGPFQRHHALF